MTEPVNLAGRGRRLAASLIDMILVPTLTLLLVMVTGVVEHAEDYQDNAWMLHVLGLAVTSYLTLNGYPLWKSGQTLGKKMLGIAIVRAGARARADAGARADARDTQQVRIEPPPFWKLVCLRAPFFPLLFLVVVPSLAALPIIDQVLIFGKRRRCLHDIVCGSLVVRLPRRR